MCTYTRLYTMWMLVNNKVEWEWMLVNLYICWTCTYVCSSRRRVGTEDPQARFRNGTANSFRSSGCSKLRRTNACRQVKRDPTPTPVPDRNVSNIMLDVYVKSCPSIYPAIIIHTVCHTCQINWLLCVKVHVTYRHVG